MAPLSNRPAPGRHTPLHVPTRTIPAGGTVLLTVARNDSTRIVAFESADDARAAAGTLRAGRHLVSDGVRINAKDGDPLPWEPEPLATSIDELTGRMVDFGVDLCAWVPPRHVVPLGNVRVEGTREAAESILRRSMDA